MRSENLRTTSFGQSGKSSPIDKFGVWLSGYQVRRRIGTLNGKDVADFGCGFNATYARSLLPVVRSATLVDVALAEELKHLSKVTALEGLLPNALDPIPSASFDVILCMSVVEHLWEPRRTIEHFHRLLRPGGVCAINVPSWRGKTALEFSAFKLGLSPASEMDDHKAYYDPRDLWPLLVQSGFQPHGIRCFRHKFFLNTFAVCTIDDADTIEFKGHS